MAVGAKQRTDALVQAVSADVKAALSNAQERYRITMTGRAATTGAKAEPA